MPPSLPCGEMGVEVIAVEEDPPGLAVLVPGDLGKLRLLALVGEEVRVATGFADQTPPRPASSTTTRGRRECSTWRRRS